MAQTMIGAVTRWLVTIWGAQQWLTQDDLMQVIGAVASLASLVWSLWQKRQNAEAGR